MSKRILYCSIGWHPFHFPATKFAGGSERTEYQQILYLKEMGYHVDVISSADSTYGIKVEANSIQGKGRGWYPHYAVKKIMEIHHEYDHVVVNHLLIRDKKLHQLESKLHMIYHLYMKDLKEKDYQRIQNYRDHGVNLYTVEEAGLSTFGNYFEVMVADAIDFSPLDQINKGSLLAFVGRMDRVKCPEKTLKACEDLGLLDQLHMFCSRGNRQWIFTYLTQDQLDRVSWDVKRETIYHLLCNSRAFIFPTKVESAGGISAFEAACHGLPVITNSVWSDRYLKPYGLKISIPENNRWAIREGLKQIPDLSADERKSIAQKVRGDFSVDKFKLQLQNMFNG